jgi:hypothetical protein
MISPCRAFALCTVTALLAMAPSARLDAAEPVYLVPNFHPASCGWLADFSTERNYCAYSYLDHLDRVREDPNYRFAMSEVNNIMAIREFEPQRIEELKQRIRERRVELVNAFFLEPTINLSGGEALVKMCVEGLRWQRQVMGVRPRLVWAIDVTGVHEQMGQIAAAFPTGSRTGRGAPRLIRTSRASPTASKRPSAGRITRWPAAVAWQSSIAASPAASSPVTPRCCSS